MTTALEKTESPPPKKRKGGFPDRVTINDNGTLSVDPVKLLQDPDVQKRLRRIRELTEQGKM